MVTGMAGAASLTSNSSGAQLSQENPTAQGVSSGQYSPASQCDSTRQIRTLTDKHYRLQNVRLEEGFEREGETVVATRTALYDLEIANGKIAAIQPVKSRQDRKSVV